MATVTDLLLEGGGGGGELIVIAKHRIIISSRTGPVCTVTCNLINTHTHTYIMNNVRRLYVQRDGRARHANRRHRSPHGYLVQPWHPLRLEHHRALPLAPPPLGAPSDLDHVHDGKFTRWPRCRPSPFAVRFLFPYLPFETGTSPDGWKK